mgnify:CR=1
MLTSFLSDAMERCMIVRTKAPEAILTRFDANRAGLKEDYYNEFTCGVYYGK